jgi:hypothetical protein
MSENAHTRLRFIVIARTGATGDSESGCEILPEGFDVPAIYTIVFGPDSYSACEQWVRQNCEQA